jgi:hypothetical protein
VPSSGQLCDRLAVLEASVTQRCEQLARRLARGEAVSMIVDSTGLSFGRASQWNEEKYGQKATRTRGARRTWRDGAYYSIERTKALSRSGVTPVIRPPVHAVAQGG